MAASHSPLKAHAPLLIAGKAISTAKLKGLDPEAHPVFFCSEEVRNITHAIAQLSGCILCLRTKVFADVGLYQRSHLFARVSVVIVGPTDDAEIIELIRQGCRGVLNNDMTPAMVRRAVTCIADGQLWAPRKLLSALVDESLASVAIPGLTVRENAVLRLVRKGHTNQEIADLLAISRETVRWYLRELGSKVGRTVREPLADAQAASAGTAPVLVRYTPERSE